MKHFQKLVFAIFLCTVLQKFHLPFQHIPYLDSFSCPEAAKSKSRPGDHNKLQTWDGWKEPVPPSTAPPPPPTPAPPAGPPPPHLLQKQATRNITSQVLSLGLCLCVMFLTHDSTNPFVVWLLGAFSVRQQQRLSHSYGSDCWRACALIFWEACYQFLLSRQ